MPENRSHGIPLPKLIRSKASVIFAVISGLFGLSFLTHSAEQGMTPLGLVGYIAALAFAAYVIAMLIYRHLSVYDIHKSWLSLQTYSAHTRRRFFLFSWLVIGSCFLVNLIFSLPGAASPDSMYAMYLAASDDPILFNYHPLIWQFMMYPFIHLGYLAGSPETTTFGMTAGLAFQCVVISGLYAYVCYWACGKGLPRMVILALVVMYGFDPVNAQYASYLSKDGMSAVLFLVYATFLIDLYLTEARVLKDRRFIVGYCVVAVLTALFRSNATYVELFVTIVVFILYAPYRKIIAGLVCIPLALMVLVGPIFDHIGIEKSPSAEALSVPLNQVGAVVAKGYDLPEDVEEVIYHVLPQEKWATKYTPWLVDPIKFDEEFDNEYLESHKTEFLRAYLKIGSEHPLTYAQAWEQLTRGYWNVQTVNWVTPYSHYHVNDEYKLEQGSNPLANRFGWEVFNRDVSNDVDVIRTSYPTFWMYNLALMFWISVYAAVMQILLRKDIRALTPWLVNAGVWLSIIAATPVYCEFRYVYPLHVTLPLLIICIALVSTHQIRPNKCVQK